MTTKALFLILFFCPQIWAQPSNMSRRGFLRGLIAGAGVAATASPSSILASGLKGGTRGLPEALKKKIVAARMKAITQSDPKTGLQVPGLEGYIEELKKMMQSSDSPVVREKLSMLIKNGERALETFLEVQKESLAYKLTQKPRRYASRPRGRANLPTSDPSSPSRLAKNKMAELIKKLNSLPPDLKIITIRSLLDPQLLKRMAWQAHFERPLVSVQDYELLQNYRELVENVLKSSQEGDLSAALAPRLLAEVNLVLSYAFETPSSFKGVSCKTLF